MWRRIMVATLTLGKATGPFANEILTVHSTLREHALTDLESSKLIHNLRVRSRSMSQGKKKHKNNRASHDNYQNKNIATVWRSVTKIRIQGLFTQGQSDTKKKINDREKKQDRRSVDFRCGITTTALG